MISTRLTRELVPRAALNRPVTHCIKQRCVVCQTAVTNEPRNAYLALAASVAGWQLFSAAACWALPPQQLQDIQQQIVQDFSERQYYVTGNLTKSLYDINCIFKDPTTNVKGVEPYTKAVAALFDPSVSRADLISTDIIGPDSITLRWRLEGKLRIGNLPIKPYTGTTVYTMDDSSGLIMRHDETWDISALDAFVSTLVPGLNFGAAPAPPVK